MTATLPPLTEKQLQRQVTELAELLGWEWVHFRPAQTEKGWRTPVSGTLGKGWVDLILVRPRDSRFLFIELKAQREKPTDDQRRVLSVLADAAGPSGEDRFMRGIEVAVWYPSDWPEIERILR